MNIKYKKNINKHLLSKRHAQGKKENISTNDETVQVNIASRDDIQELTFCRKPNVEENRKGKHFMIEVQRPIKYKFGKRLVKYMHVCTDCKKSFRNAGLLRRLTDGHRMMAKTMIKVDWKNGSRKIQRKIYQTRNRTKIEKRANLFESVYRKRGSHIHTHTCT